MVVIGFSYSRNLKGWIIRKATGGSFNHTWIGYTDQFWGGQWVVHAVAEGLVVQPASKLVELYDSSECFEVRGDIDMRKGMRETRDYINRPYDYKSVITNGLFLALYRMTGKEWFNPVVNQNKISCSEWVATVLQRAGFAPVQGRNAELFPPDGEMGLRDIFLDHPEAMRRSNFAEWLLRGCGKCAGKKELWSITPTKP